MLSKYILPGNKIKIYPIYNNSNKKHYYVSQIEEIVDKTVVKILAPIKQGNIVPLHLNESYLFDFNTPNGVFRCTSKVISRVKENNIYFVFIKLGNDIRKIQRRNYFRINCLVEFRIELVESDEEQNLDELFIPEECIIVNISGGGIKFLSRNYFNVNSEIIGSLKLKIKKDILNLNVHVKIIERELITGSSYKYVYRAKFGTLSQINREKIIKFVFEQQVNQKDKQRL